MSKNDKSDKSDKKDKKAKSEKKPRKVAPWRTKQLTRLAKATNVLEKLDSVLSAAQAPNVDVSFVKGAKFGIISLTAQVTALPADWKPAKGSRPGTAKKIGIGSTIKVRDDLDRDEAKVFKHVPAELFTSATVLDDDGRDWIVKCSDNVTRVIRKKLVALVTAAPTKTEAVQS